MFRIFTLSLHGKHLFIRLCCDKVNGVTNFGCGHDPFTVRRHRDTFRRFAQFDGAGSNALFEIDFDQYIIWLIAHIKCFTVFGHGQATRLITGFDFSYDSVVGSINNG